MARSELPAIPLKSFMEKEYGTSEKPSMRNTPFGTCNTGRSLVYASTLGSRSKARRPSSITTTLHQIGWLVSGNCIGERTGAKLSCKLAYSREGIPKSPFMPTVVVILEVWPESHWPGFALRQTDVL